MASYFEYEPEKALSLTAYLVEKTGETMYYILKMVYVSDRIHLEKYGRPITGDDFFALAEGACPTRIYNSMKALRGESKPNYMPNSEKYLSVDALTHDVTLIDTPSMDSLSMSEIECLDETVSIYKRKGRPFVRDLAHDKAWVSTQRNKEMDMLVIANSLSNVDELTQHLKNRFN